MEQKDIVISDVTEADIDKLSNSGDSGRESNFFVESYSDTSLELLKNVDSVSASSGIGSISSKNSNKINFNKFTAQKNLYILSGRKKFFTKGKISLIIAGVFFMFLGFVSLIWTPVDVLLRERTKMVRGLPAYDWWVNPPDEVLLKVYIFNISNSKQFLNGEHDKLLYEEVGPFVFQEKLQHTNVTFNNNDTMTYIAHRSVIFLPDLTNISLDTKLVLPNLAILAGASYLTDASFFTKFGFNMLMKRLGSEPLIEVTAYDYMWNLTDPIIGVAKHIMPNLVPVDNIGILQRIYSNFIDEVTVFIGPENSRKFFTIDRFKKSNRLNYWPGESCDSVANSTEGVSYHQNISRDDTLLYLRKTICRVAPLHWSEDVLQQEMNAFKFVLPDTVFHRAKSGDDCFTLPGKASLPDGLSDVSPCYYNYPIAVSLPHLLGADSSLVNSVQGMKPNRNKHESYVIVEPITGVPMESRARSQSNLVTSSMKGFNALNKFRDLTIPMFWLEYGQVGLPWYISSLMYVTVVVLPLTQHWIAYLFITIGSILFYLGFKYYFTFIYKHFIFSYNKLEKATFNNFS